MALIQRVLSTGWKHPVAILVCLLLVGCPSGTSQRPSGKVTLEFLHDGKPVNEGSVQLMIEGSPDGAFGPVDSNGVVTFSNVPVGTYTVIIMPPAEDLPDPEKPSTPKNYANIPSKFRSATTSPLKVDVGTGDKKESFDLKTK